MSCKVSGTLTEKGASVLFFGFHSSRRAILSRRRSLWDNSQTLKKTNWPVIVLRAFLFFAVALCAAPSRHVARTAARQLQAISQSGLSQCGRSRAGYHSRDADQVQITRLYVE